MLHAKTDIEERSTALQAYIGKQSDNLEGIFIPITLNLDVISK